ncbi:MATE family efflux transporter, partial [Tyzzerella sp. OttesenSCG-928-J15]|nr:MATE family efflux transporter [Tyzzerella sp. OttesenSCG-928-J15]
MQQSKTRGVDRSFYRQMLALALPIALQNLLSTSANLVDTAMITRIGNLAIAASGVAGRWNFFLNMILFGFASGSSVLISQYWGVRDIKNIQKTYGIGLLLGLLVAVAYTIICFVIPEQMVSLFTTEKELIAPTVEYLQIVAIGTIPVTYSYLSGIARRATEDVRTPVVGAIVSTLTNIFFNWVLIYGNLGAPAMGLRGAAIATTLSYFAHMIFYIILGLSKKHFTFASPKILFGFSKDYFTKYIKITAPVLANETLWGIGMNIYTIIFARQGSEYYAGYTIFSSIQQMTFIFFVGVCSACSIMVGKSVGRGELEEAYALGKRFLLMVPVMGVVLGA